MSEPDESNLLNEIEEERMIREYEEECANEGILDIRKLKLNDSNCSSSKKNETINNSKIDKCLNISDNEYLENLSFLDNESERSISTPNQPLYINTSIPQIALDNLNSLLSRVEARNQTVPNFNELDKFKDFNSSNSTLNSSQFNDQINDQINDQANGQLNNSSIKSNHPLNHNSSNDNLINCSSNDLTNNFSNNQSINLSSTNHPIKRKRTKSIITFELISARTILSTEIINSYTNNANKPYVLYTIILKKAPGLETKPAIIEKRYSDFLRFFLLLKKNFSALFENIPFPKKIYSNNFEAEVIHERATVFQDLLTYCLSLKEVRNSPVFYEFVLHAEFKKCRRLLRSSNFEEAIICLENLLFILTKLNKLESSNYLQLNIFFTYLALSACLNEIESYEESANYAQEAFEMISFNNDYDENELLIPFLLLQIQLNSRLNRCCKKQNQKLLELSENGIVYDRRESLIDFFVLKNYFVMTP